MLALGGVARASQAQSQLRSRDLALGPCGRRRFPGESYPTFLSRLPSTSPGCDQQTRTLARAARESSSLESAQHSFQKI